MSLVGRQETSVPLPHLGRRHGEARVADHPAGLHLVLKGFTATRVKGVLDWVLSVGPNWKGRGTWQSYVKYYWMSLHGFAQIWFSSPTL